MTTAFTQISDPAQALCADPDSADLNGDVLGLLDRFGVAMVPGAFAADLNALRAEFDAAFDAESDVPAELSATGKNLSRRLGRTDTGRHLKLDRDADMAALLPVAHAIFSSERVAAVTRGYLGSPASPARHVILTEDYEPREQILAEHFDELNSLKFYVYLDEIDEDNAPFQAIPGTHLQGKQIRQAEWLRVDDYNSIKSRVFEQYSQEFFYSIFGMFKELLLTRRVRFTAPAGTLLIFDTDLLHSAGRLGEGRRRRVMRASSYRGLWL